MRNYLGRGMKFVTVLELVVSALQLCDLTPVGGTTYLVTSMGANDGQNTLQQNFGFVCVCACVRAYVRVCVCVRACVRAVCMFIYIYLCHICIFSYGAPTHIVS